MIKLALMTREVKRELETIFFLRIFRFSKSSISSKGSGFFSYIIIMKKLETNGIIKKNP
jgi:hypothetical protein